MVTERRKIDFYEHPYHVQNDTHKNLYNIFKTSNPTIKIGLTTFTKLKPFFIRRCEPRDIETCCCRTHVNFSGAMESLINLCHKNNITFYQNNSNVLKSYSTVMGYIYINCERDEHGILVTCCESGDCGKWMEQFENLKSQILSNDMDFVNFDNTYVKFTHFETRKFLDANNKEKSKLIPIIENANMAYFTSYLTEKIKKFVFHSNANTRNYILWKIFVDDLNFSESSLVSIDFAENLQIPIQKEPQSLLGEKSYFNSLWNN